MNTDCDNFTHQGTPLGTLEHQLAFSHRFKTSTPFQSSAETHLSEPASAKRRKDDSGLDDSEPLEAELVDSRANMPEDPAPEIEKRKIMELILTGNKLIMNCIL